MSPPAGDRAAAACRDLLDEPRLLQWMRAAVPGFPLNAGLTVQQFVHGQSNPTYMLRTTDSSGSERRYVLRKKPGGVLLASAHAVEREFAVMRALAGSSVPVPIALALCEDASVLGAPFFVMSCVDGEVPIDETLPERSPAHRGAVYRAMAGALAAIHAVDPARVGLGGFGRPADYCRRQVTRWAAQYASSAAAIVASTGTPPAEDGAMRALAAWLAAHVPLPPAPGRSHLLHGDYRLDNLILAPGGGPTVTAVIDWELATLGDDPFPDVAYACLPYRLPPKPATAPKSYPQLGPTPPDGIPTEPQFLSLYCAAAGVPPPSPPAWAFYVALACFRGAAILTGVAARAHGGNAASASAALSGGAAAVFARAGVVAAGLVSPPLGPPPTTAGRAGAMLAAAAAFLRDHALPAEPALLSHSRSLQSTVGPWTVHPLVAALQSLAQRQGLWNCWLGAEGAAVACASLPGSDLPPWVLAGAGLSTAEYGPICELLGRSLIAPELCNCAAPDTGNMDVLIKYGSPDQQRRWLGPLLRGEAKSCFGMTEPGVASSDARLIESEIRRAGGSLVLSGRKWWTSGAGHPDCRLCIFMGRDAACAASAPHRRQSMVLVPMPSPGLTVIRPLAVFGYLDAPHGHCELSFESVTVPEADGLLLGAGRGFEIAQGRLGQGRLHHCMRLVGAAERAITAAVARGAARAPFGRPLVDQGAFLESLARRRVAIDAARALVAAAASALDSKGYRLARKAIAAAKVAAPEAALAALDWAIQVHGGAGVSPDFVLAEMYAAARTLRIADGPDEVHLMDIARLELREQAVQSKL